VDLLFGELVGGALRLDRTAFDLVEHAPHGLWTLLVALVGSSVAFDLPPALATLTTAVGFLNRALLLRLFSGVSTAGNRWRWRAQTGRAAPLRSTDALLPLGPQEHRG